MQGLVKERTWRGVPLCVCALRGDGRAPTVGLFADIFERAAHSPGKDSSSQMAKAEVQALQAVALVYRPSRRLQRHGPPLANGSAAGGPVETRVGGSFGRNLTCSGASSEMRLPSSQPSASFCGARA